MQNYKGLFFFKYEQLTLNCILNVDRLQNLSSRQTDFRNSSWTTYLWSASWKVYMLDKVSRVL